MSRLNRPPCGSVIPGLPEGRPLRFFDRGSPGTVIRLQEYVLWFTRFASKLSAHAFVTWEVPRIVYLDYSS